jgi:tetratricopeptide (TPR) repeat protein
MAPQTDDLISPAAIIPMERGPGLAQGSDPRYELGVAKEALPRGDFDHAAQHASNALAADPAWDEALMLFDRIVDAAPKKDALLPLEKETYFAYAAGRAYVLARTGRRAEAVTCLLDVMLTYPEAKYEVWAERWLAQGPLDMQVDAPEGGLFARMFAPKFPPLTPKRIGWFFASLIADCRCCVALRPAERAFYRRYSNLVMRLLALPAVRGHPPSRALGASILRRGGLVRESLAAVREPGPPEGEKDRHVMLSHAHRALGDYAAAEQAMQRVWELDREKDPSMLGEIVRIRYQAGDFAGALSLAEQSIAMRGGDRAEVPPDSEVGLMLAYLERALRNGPGNEHLARLGDKPSVFDFMEYEDRGAWELEAPGEASTNILRDMTRQGADFRGEGLKVKISSFEAPSSRLVLAMATLDSNDLARVEVEYLEIPKPDPRRPRGEPRYRVWTFDGPKTHAARQAVPPPGERVLGAVEELARRPSHPWRMWKEAEAPARELGRDAAEELMGAMVHPRPAPKGIPTWDWVCRLQIAAALIIGRLDPGWERTRSRDVLLDLLDGPIDWTTDAAVLALREKALDEPAAVGEVAQRYEALAERIPRGGYWSTRGRLALSYLRLPGRAGEKRERFRKIAAQEFSESSQPG